MPIYQHVLRAFSLMMVLLACRMVRAQGNAMDRPNTVPCCKRDMRWLKAASHDPYLEASDIRVFVDMSSLARYELTANTYGCPKRADGSFYQCDIYVTERLKESFTDEELRVVLAHELGHLVNLARTHPGSMESECAADKFAFELMKGNGEDPAIVLITLRRVFWSEVFMDPKGAKQMVLRMKRIQGMLDAERFGDTTRPGGH